MRMPANKRTDAYHDVVEQAGLPALVREVEFVKSDDEKSAVVAKILDENPRILTASLRETTRWRPSAST